MVAKRGVLMRTIPVRLLNVSSSGFLLETPESIDAGTTGIVDVGTGNERYLSPANLLRSFQRPGAGQTFHLAGMFTPSLAETKRPAPPLPAQRPDPMRALRRRSTPTPHTRVA